MDREGRPTNESVAGGRVNSVMRPLRQVYRRLTPPWTPRLEPGIFHSFGPGPARGVTGASMLCLMVLPAMLLVIATPVPVVPAASSAPIAAQVAPAVQDPATVPFPMATWMPEPTAAPVPVAAPVVTAATAPVAVAAPAAVRVVPPGAGESQWQWPLRPPPPVLRRFDPPAHPWEPGHRGVDLAAPPGRAVFATGAGRVTFARDLAGRGVITISHGTLRTTYLPVRPAVRTGQTVVAGARIGVVEARPGHCGQESCLHWGLLRDDSYLDPLSLLGLGPVRLLPWWRSSSDAAVTGEAERTPRAPSDPAEQGERPMVRRPTGRPPASPRRGPPPARAPVGPAPAMRPAGATSAIGAAAGPLAVTVAAWLALAGFRTRGRRSRRSRPSLTGKR